MNDTQYIGEFKIVSVLNEKPTEYNTPINSPESFQTYFEKNIRPTMNNAQEHLFIIALNTRLTPIGWKLVSLGSVSETSAHAREVMRPVIIAASHSFMMVHNHPSGDTTPSEADNRFTKRLREIGNLMGIELIDHIIVGENTNDKIFSFREMGML